jgi:hypothetical protein
MFGDILIPTNPNSQWPITTILNFSDPSPMVVFRTSRLGNVVMTTDAGYELYTDLYFDFLYPNYFESGMVKALEISAGVTSRRVVMWSRPNIQDQNAQDPQGNPISLEGLKLIAQDGANPVRYLIRNSVQIGNLYIADITDDGIYN